MQAIHGAADRQQFMNLFCDAVKDPMHYASQIVRAYGFDTDRANGMTAELYLYLSIRHSPLLQNMPIMRYTVR